MERLALSRRRSSETSLDVTVEYGAGRLYVSPTSDGSLYRMRLDYDEARTEPLAEYRAGELRVGAVGRDGGRGSGRREGGEMRLELADGLPMELELEFGAARAQLDLGGLALTGLQVRTGASESRLDVSRPNRARLERASFEIGAAEFTATRLGNLSAAEIEVSTGVGKVTLDLTGEWRRDAHVSVEMGLGKLELILPRDLGVRLVEDTFLTTLDAPGLVKRGDAYESPGWDTAERRVTIDVQAAFGSIVVAWVQ